MNVKAEIKKFAKKEDKHILYWLLSTYPYESQWRFVAKCEHVKYGVYSYQSNRVWSPTIEGRIIYDALNAEVKVN